MRQLRAIVMVGIVAAATVAGGAVGAPGAAAVALCGPPDLVAQQTIFVGEPSVSADGSRLAFSSEADLTGQNADGNSEIFLYDAPSDTLTQLTDTAEGTAVDSNSEPSISDDGSKVAFQSDRDFGSGNTTGYEIFLWDEAGPSITALTDVAAFAFTGEPDLSGDGSTVAFTSDGNVAGLNSSGNTEVFLVDVATTSVTAVTSTPGGEGDLAGGIEPSISEDGREVAFSSFRNLTGQNADGSQELFLFDADTDATDQLTTTTNGITDNPALSANGSRVAFRSNRAHGTTAGTNNLEIFVQNVATGVNTAVTTSGGGENRDPAISADGNRVAFWSNRDLGGLNPDLSGEVYVWDRVGGSRARASEQGTVPFDDDGAPPALSADGGTVAFATFRGSSDSAIAVTTCAPAPLPDAAIATSATGTFTGNNVYNAAVTSGQTRSATVARGATRTFHVRVQSDRSVTDTVKVKGVASGAGGYTVRYVQGGADVTAAVVAGSHTIAGLAPGASVVIKVKITATAASARGSTRTVDLTARSTTIPSVRDTVRARATRT